MSSASASRPPETAPRLRLTLWPRSLFARLFAAVLVGVLAGQFLSVALVSRERQRDYIQASVREWSRRIVDRTLALAALPAEERQQVRVPAEGRRDPGTRLEFFPGAGPEFPGSGARSALQFMSGRSPDLDRQIIAIPAQLPDFHLALERQLSLLLGVRYSVQVAPTADPARPAVMLRSFGPEPPDRGGQSFDVSISLPDGAPLLFRIDQVQRTAPWPRSLIMNLVLLSLVSAIALYLATRTITRPLSQLTRAAEAVGRDLSQPPLPERGAVELRDAARAFNTMQERLHRYVGSRTAVLAAMSHDLRTPLTRMRLRSANLADPGLQQRFDADLDEMEAMVKGALAMLRGLNDQEPLVDLDINALLSMLRREFTEMGTSFEIRGSATASYPSRPQALKRCLTNLLSNAIKFGGSVRVVVEDGAQLVIRVLDNGPGIPAEQLQKVFEPFYRLESSRNRDTGGTGLGLSIARDIAQSHGGQLRLANLSPRGLEAVLALPRAR